MKGIKMPKATGDKLSLRPQRAVKLPKPAKVSNTAPKDLKPDSYKKAALRAVNDGDIKPPDIVVLGKLT